jgi:hypothetical protein
MHTLAALDVAHETLSKASVLKTAGRILLENGFVLWPRWRALQFAQTAKKFAICKLQKKMGRAHDAAEPSALLRAQRARAAAAA